ncbi:unnamed protein product [Cylindrotheca closterium]|uniref:L domain-like protein n=1 Tax=Cylindrotheca closterium TaxID=2856 RepID=A0AAD2FGX0_9STRA|nr:unnamed protein product [Cylindrotheca closterium]
MMISSKTVVLLLLLLSLSESSAKLGDGSKARRLESNERELSAYTDYKNRPTKQVEYVGSNPSQILEHCQGDCDSNDDCGLDLICYQRNAYEEVPGCNGGRTDGSNSDYCIKSSDWEISGTPRLQVVSHYPEEASLGRCEGDCDTDEDCADDLVCYQKNDCQYVAGCLGSFDDYSYTDYCVRKSDVNAGKLALDDTVVGDFNHQQLQLCQGDCDEYYDCAPGLICLHRHANEPVPGCIGAETHFRTDYCISPNNRGNSRKDVIESSLSGGSKYSDLNVYYQNEDDSSWDYYNELELYTQDTLDWLINVDLWVPPVEEEKPQELWRERYAMAALYFATEGDKWFDPRNYLSVDSVCTWSGISDEIEIDCNENGRVVRVIGRANGMLGSIPSAMQALTMLQRIDFYDNNIRGSIPSSLAELTHLTRIDLYENNLTGKIPEELASLTKLEQISLFDNALTGTLPEGISKWTNLRRFHISDNAISGSIPNIGGWSHLTYLELSNNRISGSLPNSIGNMHDLEILVLSNNRLTGTLPSSLPRSLGHLYLRSNNIGGSLPTELGLLSNVQTIDMAYNVITGSVPSSIGRLAWLYDLDLRGNKLSGSLPSELGNMGFLTDFDAGVNNLSGEVPPLGNRLTNCSLDSNSFSDTTNAEGICRLD